MDHLFKLLILSLLFAGLGAHAQCPQNIGFENGTLNGWEAYVGEVLPNGVIEVNSTLPDPSRHQIMRESDNRVDEFGGFPTVSPNGSKFSVKLGNSDGNHQAERLSYTFLIPANNQYTLILNYAVVLQNPTNARHADTDQPRFTVTVFNVTDNRPVECPAFDFIAKSNLPGFRVSDVIPAGGDRAEVLYKDWTATTIDLSLYAGKQIKLEFTTNDCTFVEHFGYAYFDINENCQNPITGNVICENQFSARLQGPKGFATYNWFRSDDLVNPVGNEQVLSITPVPAVGTKYILKVQAATGLGCSGEFSTEIFRAGEPFVFSVQPTIFFCRGTSVDLTAPGVTAGSSSSLLPFEYYTDDVSEEYLRNPDRVTEAGVYYIRGSNAAGCTDILPVELKFYDEVNFTVADPQPVQYPATVDISATYTNEPGYQYTYFSDMQLTKPIADFRNIGSTGRYYIKALTVNGCGKVASVNVVVNPPPPYIISGPTAFTPNNDGINDLFNVTIEGFVDYGTLSVYNRSGQFLFRTNKQSNNWDGSFNGRSLPAGTYYWLFEGVDQYYHTKVIKGGYVSIIK